MRTGTQFIVKYLTLDNGNQLSEENEF